MLMPNGKLSICQQVPHLVAPPVEQPKIKKRKKKKKPIKKRPDLQAYILTLNRAKELAKNSNCELRACVEEVSAMPTDARATAFTFGYAVGSLTGILVALGIPVVGVRPVVWKKYFGLVKEAGMSSAEFKKLSQKKLKDLTGVEASTDAAEAALLAIYALNNL
jgi:hypothetical protein